MEDRSRLSEHEMLELGKQVQHLRHYLSTPSSSAGELTPAAMEDYGFTSSQLLDLCFAVRPSAVLR